MLNMTKNNLIDIMHTKRIVLVAVIIAITGMFVFSNAFVNPLLAQSSKSNDKTDSSKSKDSNSDTSSSSADKKDYKDFQKCLSTADGTKGFATKTEIQDCFRQIYSPTTASSSNSASSSTSLTNTT